MDKTGMLDKIILCGLGFLIVFSPLAFGATELWSLTVVQLVTIFLFVVMVARMIQAERVIIPSPVISGISALFVLFVFTQTLSLFGNHLNKNSLGLTFPTLSLNSAATLQAGMLLSIYLGLFFVASHYFASLAAPASTLAPSRSGYDMSTATQRLSGFTNFIIGFSFLLSVFAIVQYLSFNGKLYWVRELSQGGAPFGPFVNRNHFAGYMELTAPLALAMILGNGVPVERKPLYIFMAAIMAAALFLSASRSGALSFFGQLLFLGFLLNLTGGRKLASLSNLLIGGLFIALVLAALLWLNAETMIDRMAALSHQPEQESSRLSVWSDSLHIAADFPITGTGLGTFRFVHPIYKSEKMDLRYEEAHNDYLQVLSETGVIGAGLLLILAVCFFVKAARLIRQERHPTLIAVRIGALTGCFGLLLHSVTDFNLQIPSNALMFIILAALATSDFRSAQRMNRSVGNPIT